MAIRNRAALGIESLESRDTPTVTAIGFLGGGHAAALLQETTTGEQPAVTTHQLVTPDRFGDVPNKDPSPGGEDSEWLDLAPSAGLFRAVRGGVGCVDA
jgi:hypothetical protein